MNTMKRLMDRFRPAAHRQVRGLPEEQIRGVLATLEDNNPVYRTVLEHVYGQMENYAELLVQAGQSPEQVQGWRHRLAALKDLVEVLETNRAEARDRK